MNRKVKKAEDALSYMKYSAIGDIVIGIGVWIALAFVAGGVFMVEGLLGIIEEFRPWGLVLVGTIAAMGLVFVVDGILTLHHAGKIAEVLQAMKTDQADEQAQ